MPQALAWVVRRRSSCIRSWVRATSMPPDSVKTPSALYCSVESLVSSSISREYSIGKMKLDAWPVEPPGFGSGPLSSRTTSRQPSSARWWTRLLPTIPAPMTTALARAGMSVMMSPQANSARTAARLGRVWGWVLSGGDAWRVGHPAALDSGLRGRWPRAADSPAASSAQRRAAFAATSLVIRDVGAETDIAATTVPS